MKAHGKFPLQHKIKKNKGKILLKEILNDYVPKKLIKGKAGFAIPIDDLLRTKLKIWAEDIFESSTLINDHLNYEKVKVLWEKHKKIKSMLVNFMVNISFTKLAY